MAYTRAYPTWHNYPVVDTPATAAKLQQMEDGIVGAVQQVTTLTAPTDIVQTIQLAGESFPRVIIYADGSVKYMNGSTDPATVSAISGGAAHDLLNL